MTFINGTSSNDSYDHYGSDALIAYGYGGNDYFWGNTANDSLYGDDGNDILKGYDGNDYLYGGSGNDTLEGEYGNDYLDGGGAFIEIDTLTGGSGSDTFVIGDSTGVGYLGGYDYFTNTDGSYALITDFSAASDYIQAYAGASYSLGYGDWSGGYGLDTAIYTGGDLLAVVQDTTNVDIYRDFLFV